MLDRFRPARGTRRPPAFLAALLSAVFLFGFSFAVMPGTVEGATSTATAACGMNLRTGASTGYAIRTTARTGTTITIAATVTGGSWRATCGGRSVSGTRWYRISAINGRSVASLYGRSYLYGATGLFTAVSVAAPSPSPTPTATPTPSPTSTPTPTPTLAAACDGVNLRTGASTGYAIKASVPSGTTITVAATVPGGSWSTPCAGSSVSGSTWYRISAVNGTSVSAHYGVPYVYAATGLFSAVSAPQPAGSGAGPKVVIIVGPAGSLTSSYIAEADAAYAEAIKYTSNVVTVYSPKATWAAALTALQGASVVIYLGHGNGFPSPYRTTPWPYSQNGLGLNPTAGTDNTTVQYWGEYYLALDVTLAPNAVVLLDHLCYASGNSEPGDSAPTISEAKQRVDNMAAGWLAAGARAVVAEGHYGPAWYVHQLFTTHQTIDQVWHASPTYTGHAFTFPSVRTAGATAEMDPDGTPNGYWRAVTGWLDLTTDETIDGR